MHIRLAALIVVITALLLSFNSPSRTEAKYTELTASCLGNKGGTTAVVSACNTLMKIGDITPSRRVVLLRARGWAYYCDKQYDKALSDYSSALALSPEDGITILRRAIVFDALGDSQAAEADYLKRLQIDPNGRDPLFYKAKFDHRKGNLSEAIQGYEKVLEIQPDHRNTGVLLTNIYLESEGVEHANQFLSQAQKRWPDQSWVYDAQMKIALKYTGDVESALLAASNYVRLGSRPEFDAVVLPALIHLKIGDETEGIEYVKRLVEQGFPYQPSWKGWYIDALSWIAFGQGSQWLYRTVVYAGFGRTDLAKIEVDAFLQATGKNGRLVFLDTVQKAGIPVSVEARAGAPAQLEETIMRYLRHIEEQASFKDYGPSEKG